jgi:hypothetical protein
MIPTLATQLHSPRDLISAIPFLIGYHPKNSLVVISINDGAIGMAMRMDYPESDHHAIATSAVTLASHVKRERADAAIIVAYLPDAVNFDGEGTRAVRHAITEQSIPLLDTLEIKESKYRSLLCDDTSCCPVDGSEIHGFEESRVVTEQVVAGHPLPFASLGEMKNSIGPSEEDMALNSELAKLSLIEYEVLNPSEVLLAQREGALALDQLCEEFEERGMGVDRALVAKVLIRLHDLQVRDYAMGLGGIESVSTPEGLEILWAMWRWLLRIAPSGYVAPVASVFALMTYERGDGALARRALDRALAENDEYSMALLLRRTFAAGWPPKNFTAMREELHPKICAALFSEEVGENTLSA